MQIRTNHARRRPPARAAFVAMTQAEAARKRGAPQEALATLLEASRRFPGDADLHAGIASVLTDLGQHQGAIGAGLTAVSLAPDRPRAQAELGRALFEAGQAKAALEPCARAVLLAPGVLASIVTLGAVLYSLGRHDQALQAANEAVSLDPEHFPSRSNLALALEALGRLDEAEAQSRIALSLRPESPAARHNLAGLRLSRGKLDRESWSLYEARLGLSPAARALAAIPRWQGEDLVGRTLLLHAEQGFGDVIQFVRFAPALKARGARVVLAVPAPLLRLMATAPGVDEVVEAGTELPPHDVFCPIASLPGLLEVTLDSIPAPRSYLSAGPSTLPPRGRSLRVGLVWSGNPGFVHDRLRSMPADVLGALHGMAGVEFHSLQKGAPPPFPMQDRMDACADFADTARLVAGLDLVIAVDTAVAHLAGALGRPVWLLSRFTGCWRWLRDRADTPWYPSMRIYRQPRPGDWPGVMAAVQRDLVAVLEGD